MSDTDLAKRLLDLREEIKKAEQEKTRLEGKLESLMEQLKKETGTSSVEEAKEMLGKLEKEIDELQTELEEGLCGLEKEYSI